MAIEWHQKALLIREKVLGKEHPETAESYNAIAMVCYDASDYNHAMVWCQKALSVYEKVFGKEHPTTKTVLKNMNIIVQRL